MPPSLLPAYQGSLIADALAMPVHWYYNREALDQDSPDLTTFQSPEKHHPDSIFWRSSYTELNEKGEILHDQALSWGIKDEHIGGLAQAPALVVALQERPREEIQQMVKTHVALTHRNANVLRAADCLTRILFDLQEGIPLREAIMRCASDWFSTRKALTWEPRPDRTVIGTLLSPSCYIAEAFRYIKVSLAAFHFPELN